MTRVHSFHRASVVKVVGFISHCCPVNAGPWGQSRFLMTCSPTVSYGHQPGAIIWHQQAGTCISQLLDKNTAISTNQLLHFFLYLYFSSRQSEVMLTSDVHYDTRQFSSDQESCNKMLSSLEVPVNQSDFRIQLIAAAPGSGSKWCRTSISLLTGKLVHQLRKNY